MSTSRTKERILRPVRATKELVEIRPQHIVVKCKLRVWAAENAFTLIFLSSMFFITWVILLVTRYV